VGKKSKIGSGLFTMIITGTDIINYLRDYKTLIYIMGMGPGWERKGRGEVFQSLIPDGKKENLMYTLTVGNIHRITCGIKKSLGISTRSLIILYIIVSLASSSMLFVVEVMTD